MTCQRSKRLSWGPRILSLDFRENPAWVAKALARNMEDLQAKVVPAYLPLITDAKAKLEKVVVEFKEYGCGAYGCVLPTHDTGVVMKVTTDQSEAAFVEKAMAWGWPAGITAYYGVMPLRGEFRVSRRAPTAPAWTLWRESATELGSLDVLEALEDVGETQVAFEQRQQSFKLFDLVRAAGSRLYALDIAAKSHERYANIWLEAYAARADVAYLFQKPPKEWQKGLKRFEQEEPWVDLAAHMEAYVRTVKLMEHHPTTSAVGLALTFYLDRQIVMADLHTGNFGIVQRADAAPTWAITDPGHIIDLPLSWD